MWKSQNTGEVGQVGGWDVGDCVSKRRFVKPCIKKIYFRGTISFGCIE